MDSSPSAVRFRSASRAAATGFKEMIFPNRMENKVNRHGGDLVAFVRTPSPELASCELTHIRRDPIEPEKAIVQHKEYVRVLRQLGVRTIELPALAGAPDGVFTEDTAVVLDEGAMICRPGAISRRNESAAIEAELARLRDVSRISSPGTLDGGDVMKIGRTLFVGHSTRTNEHGIVQLSAWAKSHAYDVLAVPVAGSLHLKTACTFVPPGWLLANPKWVDCNSFRDIALLSVDDNEPFAANTLTVAGITLVSASFPRTAERLCKAGVVTRVVDISELHKAEAGLTCLSVILRARIHPDS